LAEVEIARAQGDTRKSLIEGDFGEVLQPKSPIRRHKKTA